MELATGHLLTALYSLSNQVALTASEFERVASRPAFTPAVWDQTKALLKAADRGAVGTELSLGPLTDVFEWLGVPDEAAFIDRFGGIGIDEALARDRGRLSGAAASLDGTHAKPKPLDRSISHAWSARAMRLMDGLPETAQQVLYSLELALDGSRWEPEHVRPLFEAIAHVAEMIDDQGRLSGARKMLERIDQERNDDTAPDEPERLPVAVVAQVLTAVWCLTHEGLLLEEERALEPCIGRSGDTWVQIAAAASECRADDIPPPVGLLRAWGAPQDLNEKAVRDCVRRCAPLLPQIVAEVTRLWGGGETVDMDVFDEIARAVAGIALVRHQGLHERWDPLTGERNSMWIEVHQGAQRPRTLERAKLMRTLRPVLLRAKVDLLVVATAHLDAAAESRAEGQHHETRSHLEQAKRCTANCEDPVRRAYGAASVAHHIWLEGNADDAMRRLLKLEGEQAKNLVRTIKAHAQEREALRQAEEVHAERQNVDSMCALVTAHVAAGHTIRAEGLARDGIQRYPDDPKAWNVASWVLFVTDHYRYALVPALEALVKGIGRTTGITLLARILAHLGSEWTEESARLAGKAIQADDARKVLPSDVLAELADIVQYHGADIMPALVADDLVSDLAAEDPPPVEWLGAAVARRIHGVWSEDAPEWLARLADAGTFAAAELARFIVDRVEVLLWWRDLVEREMEAGAGSSVGEPGKSISSEDAQTRARHLARVAAVGAALRAANSLEHAEPDLDDGEGSGSPIEPAAHWVSHTKVFASCFGDDLVVRIRSSELMQAVWFGPGELGESDLLAVLATFDHERVAWIRWVSKCEAVADLNGIAGIAEATRTRLRQVFEVAEIGGDIRELSWFTRLHEAERR